MSKAKRKAIFAAGAQALSRYFSHAEPLYACPICLNAFPEAAVDAGMLTLEHVPPKSVGGIGLVLTCRACNSAAGHSVDAAVDRREDHMRFGEALSGEGDYSGRVKMQLGDLAMNFHLKKTAGGPLELGGTGNSPEVTSQFVEQMNSHVENGTWDGLSYDLTLATRYDRRLARAGDLRTAYLLVFALLGYRYALDPRINQIRQQIREPLNEIVTGYWAGLPTSATKTIALASEPTEMIVVTLGFQAILLPSLGGPADPYGELSSRYAKNSQITMRGERLRWPERATFGLDQGGSRMGTLHNPDASGA